MMFTITLASVATSVGLIAAVLTVELHITYPQFLFRRFEVTEKARSRLTIITSISCVVSCMLMIFA